MPQIQQLDTFISQIFWLVVTFVGLFIFLRLVALPKVTEVLDARGLDVVVGLARDHGPTTSDGERREGGDRRTRTHDGLSGRKHLP